MLDTIRNRLILIALMIAASIWALWPVKIVNEVRAPNGTLRPDTSNQYVKLGLDLQGGIHLALELDESKGAIPNKSDAIDRALKVIRTRIDEFGVAEPLIQKEGASRIIVELPGIADPQRAKAIVERSAFLAFHLTDKAELFRRALPSIDRALTTDGITEANVARAVAESSVTTPGAAPAAPGSAVEDLLSGQPPRDTSSTAARDTSKAGRARSHADTSRQDTSVIAGEGNGPLTPLLLQGSEEGQFLVPEEKVPIVQALLARPETQRLIPRGVILRWGNDTLARAARAYRPLYSLEAHPLVTGEYLVDAQARLDPVTNQATVQFQLNRRGGRIFERGTGENIGRFMAILLDTLVQGPPPVIQGQIDTHGQIELGSGTLQNAQDLALVLKAGALPAPLHVVDQRTVGATLGKDSIHQSIVAGIVGIIAVIVIMIGYYRFAGVLAVVALTLYVLFTLAGLAGLSATLTLPGLAGFVLSIGIAVDANVLIFERIREELVHGKSLRLAIDEGFKMAMNAIVDSNVSTVLTAAFLFQFGTGPVKGFAVTLILGIIASMVTAVFVTRTFFLIWLQRRPGATALSI